MTGWTELSRELDRWRDAGRAATFWWRDDDAVAASDALERLLACAGPVPLSLAVVPALAERSLMERLQRAPAVSVLQHGWTHANHAKGGPPSEYPAGRDPGEVAAEFRKGFERLREVFDARSLPVFAPPWHGFDAAYLGLLAPAGLKAFSRRGARKSRVAAGLVHANVHCVPIAWTEPPSFGADADYLAMILRHLEARRLGTGDADEPTGILTHHLVQDARSYEFLSRLCALIEAHPAAAWLGAGEVFDLKPERR